MGAATRLASLMAGSAFSIRLGTSTVRVDRLADGALRVGDHVVRTASTDGREWHVTIDGRAHRLLVAGATESPWIWFAGRVYRPEVGDATLPERVRRPDLAGSLAAPMPATVRAIHVAVGDRVRRGDTLVVLEAMKMELPVKSPIDGAVTAVDCAIGELVQAGVPLVAIS